MSRSLLSLLLVFGLAGLVAGCDTTCDPGDICPWFGIGEAGYSEDGTHRLEAATFWSVDVAFSPDDEPYIIDSKDYTFDYAYTFKFESFKFKSE